MFESNKAYFNRSNESEARIVDYREFLKMKRGKQKQKDFAKELGVSENTIQKLNVVNKILHLLG